MTEVERFILIGCLLQGALGRDFAVMLPQSIEVLSGSCVLIPCRFEIPPEMINDLVAPAKGIWRKSHTGGRVVFDSSIAPGNNEIEGTLLGQLLRKNCTTILDRFPSSYRDHYFYRFENPKFLYTFATAIHINAQDSPPKPKLTPEKVEVMEGTSVSLSCSAAAPCPKLPPNLTWTPRLSDSVDQLQENEDNTTSVSSDLTFTASHLHHGQKITCRALYTLQQGGNQTSEASLILTVLYMPQISGSGSCSRTAAEISCSCESRGNPSPSMEWHVSGLRVTNSTDRVIREEQLGNTGLRSSLTMRPHRETRPLSSASVPTLSGTPASSSTPRLHSDTQRLPAAENPVCSNLGGTDPQPLPELETIHYASIKHSPRSVETLGQDAREGAAGHGDDVVYSQVARKKKTKKGKQQDGEGLGEG
ncbi:hypothetical protein COCON_G00002180 [Conger conger]|uniref:Ig-like domain-containing protein n=1 Tax=Conger conger TaxID=82655 RepID=A0A9Q1E1G4_CONCO|nr:hypothetical protein COCON_G00002180 [Conger conger]